ncbi:MAG TPA: hypothetical protein DCO80_09685 [Ornithinibacillus sp.]|nr:hypothetical protein [Ornithinibacillus sp.]
MLNRISMFVLIIFLISLGMFIFVLTSGYTSEYLLGYGIPTSIFSGFALIAFVLSTKNKDR